jgi:hypothetical protein
MWITTTPGSAGANWAAATDDGPHVEAHPCPKSGVEIQKQETKRMDHRRVL